MKKDRYSALSDVLDELSAAEKAFPSMHSAHEGYAILKEEVDELWQEVMKNPRTRCRDALRKEAIQVAAMALRFVRDVCDG